MSDDKEPISCGDFIVKANTDLAFLLVDAAIEGPNPPEYWIPKSQLDTDSDIDNYSQVGDEGELIIPEWLAVEKGLV